ncbi:MAG: radical SAM protein, partial [Candidatus Lambdaproteobacteria bacterium]|nr:radical SAM protein [Candidatus Lambdaproteobacteria bacterium]
MSQQGDAQAVSGLHAAGSTPVLSAAGAEVGKILDKALAGGKVSIAEGARLLQASGPELLPLMAAADHLRRETVGEVVTYVVNRNINFTNVCTRKCGFCAFSRGHAAQEGYFLPMEEVLRRAREAAELGATEVCVQAGLAPGMDGMHYVNVCRAIKQALPEMHIHGFSPEEVLYG